MLGWSERHDSIWQGSWFFFHNDGGDKGTGTDCIALVHTIVFLLDRVDEGLLALFSVDMESKGDHLENDCLCCYAPFCCLPSGRQLVAGGPRLSSQGFTCSSSRVPRRPLLSNSMPPGRSFTPCHWPATSLAAPAPPFSPFSRGSASPLSSAPPHCCSSAGSTCPSIDASLSAAASDR